ncbi:beta-1,3-galactosyltransferase 1-like [Patiria miniata]|uniref:Hexosyltransferase n=1 Tax=Patiria miniata TaxID=46514 RepID=A0A913ZRL8_PATMI|nr:beta-1,3-galactosyltransferase 1-like [Patiria miniata]
MCMIRTYSLLRMFYTIVLVYVFVVCLLVGYSVVGPDAYPPTTEKPTVPSIDDLEEASLNISSIRQTEEEWERISDEIPDWANITTGPLFSDEVINPHPFNFTIANKDACFRRNDTKGQLFLVILVKCRPNETYDREQIRRTWGGVKQVLGRRTLTMFLVGQTTDSVANSKLRDEDNDHRDFIQEDFIDAYHNMTHKTIMGLKWVALFCRQASYVLSVDSDMTLNIYNLVVRLIEMPRTSFAEGNLRADPKPHRSRESKWYTPYDMYPEPTYAPFLNGACYAMSGDVAISVYRESVHVRFLQWDDVFVGLVMKRVGVQPGLCPLYEQFHGVKVALRRGIGRGLRHNIKKVNEYVINIWENVVGKRLRNENKTPHFAWSLLLLNVVFIVAICIGCSIHIWTIAETEKA